MFANVRIATKLALVSGLSALLALLVSGILILELYTAQLQSNFEERLARQTVLFSKTLNAAVIFEDWETVQELTQALLTDPAVCSASVYDSTKQPRVEVGQGCPGETNTGIVSFSRPETRSERVGIVVADAPVGELLVIAHNSEVQEYIDQLLWKVLLATIGGLLLSFLLTMRAQLKLIRPVILLTDMVRRIRQTGNYALRGEVVSTDEVGQLTADVNTMLEIIDQRDQFLAKEVDARTVDLKEKNAELEVEMHRRSMADQALRDSEQRFSNAFQNAPIGMAIIDCNGMIMQANDALVALTGKIGEVTYIQSYLAPDEVSGFQEDIQRTLTRVGKATKRLCSIRSISGEELTCNVSLSGIPDLAGELNHCILQLEDVTQAVRLSQELEYQALHDALTGLGNRRVLEQSLTKANADAARNPFSLALLDLDQFKIVNDTCGHEAGDILLKQVAQLLIDAVREEDRVVRLGGDEFALVLNDCGEEGAASVAEKVRSRIESMTFHWQGDNFRVGTSIGVLTVHEPIADVSEILRMADSACFAAKDAGRNRVYQVRENDEMLAKTQGEMHWVHRIQNAIENDEFTLYAQPIVALQPNSTRQRFEILIRLRDYEHSRIIPPGAFLASAERYGLSARIDRWVIGKLIEQLRAYTDVFGDNRSYWVNLSGHSLSDPVFLTELETKLVESQLLPGTINFEVTETAVISNLNAAATAMARLKALGCSFALDDFGSGLSSFGYLRKLPVDFVKIDGSFVKNILTDEVDRIFVKSIIDIVRTMRIQTVAEFVEDPKTMELLRTMGADFAQGFALGRPSPLLPAPAYSAPIDADVRTNRLTR